MRLKAPILLMMFSIISSYVNAQNYIDAFPVVESFENGMGIFHNVNEGGLDMEVVQPELHERLPYHGNKHLLKEVVFGELNEDDSVVIESDFIIVRGLVNPELSFIYRFYETDWRLQISSENDQWVTKWQSADLGSSDWRYQNIDLTEYLDDTIQVRIIANYPANERVELVLDYFRVGEALNINPLAIYDIANVDSGVVELSFDFQNNKVILERSDDNIVYNSVDTLDIVSGSHIDSNAIFRQLNYYRCRIVDNGFQELSIPSNTVRIFNKIPHCASSNYQTEGVQITHTRFNNNNCESEGYSSSQFFTYRNRSVVSVLGASPIMSYEIEARDNNFPKYVSIKALIDFNDNGQFEDDELVDSLSSIQLTASNMEYRYFLPEFQIPEDLDFNSSLLVRVVVDEKEYASNLDLCNVITGTIDDIEIQFLNELQDIDHELNILPNSDSALLVKWNPNLIGEYNTIIERKDHPDSSFMEITQVVSSKTFFIDKTVQNGNTYFYRIKFEGHQVSPYSDIVEGSSSISYYSKIDSNVPLVSCNLWGNEAFIDYDNDNDLDLFSISATYDTYSNNILYQNMGEGNFDEVIIDADFLNYIPLHGQSWGDYDNDGWIDVFFTSWQSDYRQVYLYKNNQDGTFTEIDTLDLTMQSIRSINSAWGDYNNDGYLDLFVNDRDGQDRIYRNVNGLNFEQAILLPNSTNGPDRSIGTWVDYNNDGKLDLFVGHDRGQDQLFKSLGDGTFEDQSTLIAIDSIARGGWTKSLWGDFDNDGNQELITILDYKAIHFEYNNNNSFTRTLISDTSKLAVNITSNDINNDGWNDLIIQSFDEVYGEYHNDILLNSKDGNFGFIDAGAIINDDSRSFTLGDFDNDGDFDLKTDRGGFYVNNNLEGNNYLTLKLRGTVSNSMGYGTKVKAKVRGRWYYQSLIQNTGGNGFDAPYIHFGLEKNLGIDSLVIDWPSGIEQVLTQVEANQILTIVEEESFVVEGVIYHDLNENGARDQDEYGLVNQRVMLLPDSCFTVTNSEGEYRFNVGEGEYEVLWMSDSNWTLTTDSASYTVSFPDDEGDSLDFGLKPSNQIVKLETSIRSATTRCFAEVPFWINYQNKGTVSTDGNVSFVLDSNTTYISSFPLVDGIIGDTLVWNFSDFHPGSQNLIRVNLQMPGVESVGDTLFFTSKINAIDNDTSIYADRDSLLSEFRCAYDPNDKIVTPIGVKEEHYTLIDSELEYTIRFQNTGNDTAFNVIIQDTLAAELNLDSFELIASSHDVQVQVENDGAVAFSFIEIMLPDSLVDEPNSHGFVTFRIKAKEGLSDITPVNNTAFIYFDFNPPIQTNYTLNTLVYSIPVEQPTGLVATTESRTSITVNWEDNADNESGYVIERSISDTTSFEAIDTLLINQVDYLDSGLSPNTIYYYRVRVIDNLLYTNYDSAKTYNVEADFTVSIACEDKLTTFTSTSLVADGNIVNYEWDFDNDGLIDKSGSDLNQVTHRYNETGLATITLRVTDDQGMESAISKTITVNPSPFMLLITQNACEDSAMVFYAVSAGPEVKVKEYWWDFDNDGIFESSGDDSTYNYISPVSGLYYVGLVAIAENGCIDSTLSEKTSFPHPIVNFNFEHDCEDSLITFTSTSTLSFGELSTFEWDFDGDGIFEVMGTETSVNTTYSVAGDYSPILRVTSENGCIDTAQQVITIYPNPIAEFEGEDVCEDSVAVFTNNSSLSTGNIASFIWDLGDDNSEEVFDNSPLNHTYSDAGIYTISMIATSDNGCVDTTEKQLEVFENPEATFEQDGQILEASEGFAYQWYLDGAVIPSSQGGDEKVFEVIETGSYQVEVFNALGCSSISVAVIVNDLDNESLAQDLIVYPNPFKDGENVLIQLENEYHGKVVLKVVDNLGRIIKVVEEVKSSDKFKHSLDFDSMPQGIYNIQVFLNGKWVVQKVIRL